MCANQKHCWTAEEQSELLNWKTMEKLQHHDLLTCLHLCYQILAETMMNPEALESWPWLAVQWISGACKQALVSLLDKVVALAQSLVGSNNPPVHARLCHTPCICEHHEDRRSFCTGTLACISLGEQLGRSRRNLCAVAP